LQKHILVVADDDLMRCGMAFNLEQSGYCASNAASAADALALARCTVPDLILLVIGLPDMDGPAAMCPQGTYEWLRGEPSAAQKWWQKSLAEAERIGLKYDIGMIHLEMGKRLGDRVYLEKAEVIFAEIGPELDLSKARELLQR